MQRKLVIIPPKSEKNTKKVGQLRDKSIKIEKWNIPIPANFKRRAAKIIEPSTGASTWAWGSQIWKPYKGNFTKKAMSIIKYRQEFKRFFWGIMLIKLNWTKLVIEFK